MSALAAPTGNPAALDASVDQYAATERALADAAARIETALAEGEGQAIEELRARSGRATSGMRAAHERYQAAAGALRDYAVELRQFHHDAHAAIADHDAAAARLSHAQWQLEEASRQVREAASQPDVPYLMDEAQHALRTARAAVDAAQDVMHAAERAYQAAAARVEEAAREAAARIVAGFEATRDSLLDHLSHAFEALGNLLEALVEWATAFFREVLQLIADAVLLFLTAVLVVLVVVALIALVVIALALALVVIALAIQAIIVIAAAVVLLIVELAVAGFAAYQIADALGIEGAERLRLIVGALSVVCPALGVYIVSRLVDEARKPAPDVNELSESGLTADQQDVLDRLDATLPTSTAELLSMAGMVDEVGGNTQAVVNIARVVDENGNVSWIVTLPSTMDWVGLSDQGAPNDLDADLMLMLFPELRTQYEKAVLDAMAQAGIGPNEPVVLTGWSLGGIMGGSLIEADAGGYNYAGLVCAGSPVDGMAIPADIPVLQVKHTLDPVHRTDLIDQGPDSTTHVEVWDGPGSQGVSPGIKTGNGVGHSNPDYVSTLQDHLTYNAEHGLPDLDNPFESSVLPFDDPHTPQRVTVTHEQYAFHE